jgi:hypothetical protein
MGDDPGHTDRSTDEEFEGLRHVRVGKLPVRVAPADLVETTETGSPAWGVGAASGAPGVG